MFFLANCSCRKTSVDAAWGETVKKVGTDVFLG